MSCCQPVPYSPPLGCLGFGGQGGPLPCSGEPVVIENFIEPEVGFTVVLPVNSTTNLYRGMGIKIATSIYQIQEIINATQILAIRVSGLEYSAGTVVIAKDPTYGCYQYRLTNVGAVSVPYTPTALTASNAALTISSGITFTEDLAGRWRQLGPTTYAAEALWKGNLNGTGAILLLSFPDIGIPISIGAETPFPTGSVYSVQLGSTWTPMMFRITLISGVYYAVLTTASGAALGANNNVAVSTSFTFEVPL
jgi:hypothetical protein